MRACEEIWRASGSGREKIQSVAAGRRTLFTQPTAGRRAALNIGTLACDSYTEEQAGNPGPQGAQVGSSRVGLEGDTFGKP